MREFQALDMTQELTDYLDQLLAGGTWLNPKAWFMLIAYLFLVLFHLRGRLTANSPQSEQLRPANHLQGIKSAAFRRGGVCGVTFGP